MVTLAFPSLNSTPPRTMNEKHLLLAVAVLTSGQALVAQKWITNPGNGHLYSATAVMTWKQAEAQAIKWGGHLATIRNRTEHDWIYNQFKNRVPNAGDAYWIGYTDEAKEGTWVWTSGEKPSPKFELWFTGEPNNALGKEHYAHVWGPKGDPDRRAAGFWNDGANVPLRRPQGGFIGIVEVRPASFSTFGKGCASTAVLPTISSTTPPKLGQNFTFTVTGFLPKLQFGQLIMGRSSTLWGIIPLPLSLGVIGASNCNLNVSLDSTLLIVTNAQGNFRTTLKVPALTSLQGTVLYGQAAAPDPKSNPVGIATTNGFKVTIGR